MQAVALYILGYCFSTQDFPMFTKRSLLRTSLALAAAATLGLAAQAQEKTIKVGVTAGPHAQIMDFVKKIAAKNGLKIQVVEFGDYVQPNAALSAGDLDANSYQHRPYLDAQAKDRGYKISWAADTVNFPMGIYSKKIKKLADLRDSAKFGLPNDPTNGGRALLLLQAQGLIKLKDNAGLKATPLDVVSNPKKLKFVELDAAQLPRSLDDLDASTVNTNFAIAAGLNPQTDAIAMESAKNPYVNIRVVRDADKDKPWLAQLIKTYHSDEVRQFIDKEFKGSVLPAF